MSRFALQLERTIIGAINKVSKGELTTSQAGINAKISRLKEMDEVAAEDMQKRYIKALKEKK